MLSYLAEPSGMRLLPRVLQLVADEPDGDVVLRLPEQLPLADGGPPRDQLDRSLHGW